MPSDTIPKIPQRLRYFDESGAAREELWGLLVREERSALMVGAYVLVALSPWFVFFFVYLFGLGGGTIDLQNAATPLTLSMTSLALLIAWLVK